MQATVELLEEVAEDQPIELLARRRVFGEQMLWAHVRLAKGCRVATHSHVSEQIAFVVSGRVLWRLGSEGNPDYREIEARGGTVVRLPSNVPHGVEALEDSVVIDVLSPPGEMGVDRQSTVISAGP